MITNTAVKAIIFNSKNKFILLLRNPLHKRTINNPYTKNISQDKEGIWDLPGGRLEDKEDHIKALNREIKEELGIEIKNIKKSYTWNFIGLDKKKIKVYNYICVPVKVLKSRDIKLDSEHIKYKWINPKDIEKYKVKDNSLYNAILKLNKD